MTSVHIPSFYPEKLAEILTHINDKMNLDLSIQVTTGNSGRELVHVSNDHHYRPTKPYKHHGARS